MTFGLTLIAAGLLGVAGGVAISAATAGACIAAALAILSLTPLATERMWRRTLVALTTGLAAMAHGAAAGDHVVNAPLAQWTGPVVVQGRLVEDASVNDSSVRLVIDVDEIEDGRRTYDVEGRIQAFVGGDFAAGVIREWTAGRSVRAPATLRRPPVALNPGGPSERWQVLRRPFVLTGTIKSALVVETTPGPWWDEWAAESRARVRQRAGQLFPDAADHTGPVVIAILIGDRSWLDDSIERRLQIAGTYHVIAISGGNVALLTGAIYVCLRLLVRSARVISILTMASVVTYGWIVGGDPSVTRAVVAALVYLMCGTFGLVPTALNVLAVVAAIVTAIDPLTIIDAGAWLSFGATFGIVVGAGRLLAWHGRRKPSRGARATVRRFFVALTAATLAAEITLLPVAASLFTRVGVAGLLLNVVAIPMIAVVQMSAVVGIALVGMVDAGAAAAAAAARGATHALLESARLVEIAPWLSWRVPPPAGVLVIAFYLTGLAWIAFSTGSLRRAAGWTFASLVLAIALEPATGWRRPPTGWLRLTMIDVGQGDAMLLQFPTGQSLVVDAGGKGSRFDLGERVVSPVLWASGVRRLDWLAVTHADLDHIGGASSVAATFRPKEIWEGVPVPREVERERLWNRSSTWRQLQRGDRLRIGDVTIDVLNPPLPDWERQRVRNDDSLVLRVRYRDVDVLLTGDIGLETERTVTLSMPVGEPAPIRILKVAHHGSRSSSSAPFLAAYAPHVALISAGQGNPFGHPAPDVVARLVAAGAQVFRTDRDGAAVIETDGQSLTVRSMRGREWTMRVWRTRA